MSQPNPFKSLITLSLFLAVKQLDFTNPALLQVVYTTFFVVHVLVFIVLREIYRRITSRADAGKLSYQKKSQENFMHVKSETITTTVMEYDLEKLKELALKRLGMGLLIIAFIHYKWAVVPPLIYQCVHNPMLVYDSPLFQIHMLKKKAIGDLSRPFAETNPILKFAEGAEVPASGKK